MLDARCLADAAVRGVYAVGLMASVVEDRNDDVTSVEQGSADLDLAVVPLEAAAQRPVGYCS